MVKSIENTDVRPWVDEKIRHLGWKMVVSENGLIDEGINESLKNNPSKSGGDGGGRPDHQIIITNGDKTIPVFIEDKGTQNKLEKLDKQNLLIIRKDDGKYDFKTIGNYATNGAYYYASNALKDTHLNEVLFIGVNGTKDSANQLNIDISVYLLNKKDPELAIKVGDFSDFNFLKNDNDQKDIFFKKIDEVQLDPKELEQRAIRDDAQIENVLQNLNQKIHDENQIIPSQRINIVSGALMAAVGVKDKQGNWKVSRLNPSELKGSDEEGNTDGDKILNKISNFLKQRNLPEKKQRQILNVLRNNFVDNNLNQKTSNQSQTPVKSIYQEIYDKLLPIYDITGINDFTGKLFNVMNSWVDVPDGGANDVVLTPRYVTNFMAKLAQVNMDSYVWDWALGSGGFLISSMNLMISDAQQKLSDNLDEQHNKIEHIKTSQLLGIELLPNVYMLAVLNMILMGDGSSNILNEDSLKNYTGKYAYNDDPFPANVFLLNPPYSAEGNGMIFVEKAFKKQKDGYGAVIIQDSAGSGKATEINKRILKNNRLKASIKMPIDLFKASVQTSIYLFEVGTPHDSNDNVLFFDLRDDGYTRTSRKKAKNNLINSNDAKGHYKEVIDIILDKAKKTNYFRENENYYRDTINPLNGNDWNYNNRNTEKANEYDFVNNINNYLSWDIKQVLNKSKVEILESPNFRLEDKIKSKYPDITNKDFVISSIFKKMKHHTLKYKTGDLPSSPKGKYILPALTAGILNQGLNNYVPVENATIFQNVISVSANGANTGAMFYQTRPFTVLQDSYVIDLISKPEHINKAYLYLVSVLQKAIRSNFDWSNKAGWEKIKDKIINLPVNNNGELAFDYMENYIKEVENRNLNSVSNYIMSKFNE